MTFPSTPEVRPVDDPLPDPAASPAPDETVDILLVDDQEPNLEALEAVLGDLRQNLYRARSGEEALRMMFNRDFAVVLLDVRMPGMDGFETASFIRRRPRSRRTPIIFVTAVDDSLDQISRGYSLGAVDYILKPINADILRSKVRVFVDLAQKTRSLEREVAERRRVEEELRAANRELEAFSYTVSHDLRAPLRAMAGFSDLLLEDYGPLLGGGGTDFARRIAQAARHMDALIQDLLTFSRITRERVEIRDVDPRAAVTDALSQLSMPDGVVRVEGALPAVRGNGVLLVQVFVNLLSNAVKFVRPEIRPEVRIRAEASEERVRVWVEDNGIGIEPEHHERIFRVFERLNPRPNYPGTGIGLAIVRRAMERLRGRCGVESEPGSGARFWIELPAAQGR